MSLIRVIAAVLILSMPGAALAQEWTEFASKDDLFTCNFPGAPKVTPTTWRPTGNHWQKARRLLPKPRLVL